MTDIESQKKGYGIGIDQQELIKKIVNEITVSYYERVKENSDRVFNLVYLWTNLKNSSNFSDNLAIDDILRFSVVFTHATLEDFLRTLAAKLYPISAEETLNKIPLVSQDSAFGRAEKFHLGKLAQFRGNTVDKVIEDSVLKYLEHSNFNTVTEISSLLQSLDIDVSKVDGSFPQLDELMKRRHLIVHRADRLEQIGSNNHNIQKIKQEDVISWMNALIDFIKEVTAQIVEKHVNTVLKKPIGMLGKEII